MLRIERKIVIVTRPTRLQGLVAQFATPQQARFKMVSAKVASRAPAVMAQSAIAMAKEEAATEKVAERDFQQLQNEDADYSGIVASLRNELADLAPVQVLDRQYLPNYMFGPEDIVVTVGQDGLVANTAKYALGRPIVAINPDPKQFDGILLPFSRDNAAAAVRQALHGHAKTRSVTLAEATLLDGQRLLAFNDLFIGARTHVSARYAIDVNGKRERQSSSGVIVSTGAGSTGWLSSILNMHAATERLAANNAAKNVASNSAPLNLRLQWDDPRLVFVTREPFRSNVSATNLTSGMLAPGADLVIESEMSREGVIFSDGVESDFLSFNAGAICRIRTARDRAVLVIASS